MEQQEEQKTETVQPAAPAQPQQERVRLNVGGREIILLGTAHVSRESVDEVRRVITEEKPDRVCVELDDGRYTSMSQGSSWQNLNVGKVIRQGKGFLLMANLVLASFQRRLGKDLGVKPGEEMLAAVQVSQELGIPFSLCDRNIQATLRRAWSRTSGWGKMKMLAALLTSVFSDEKLSAEDIEKLKQKDVLASMMEELAAYLPAAKEVLIDERDIYLAAKIFLSEGTRVVAVVGAGHMAGIAAHITAMGEGRESTDVSHLEELPSKRLAGRILPWAIPAIIVALFALGFIRAGWSMSSAMLLRWIIIHGGLAAVGAALSFAHPADHPGCICHGAYRHVEPVREDRAVHGRGRGLPAQAAREGRGEPVRGRGQLPRLLHQPGDAHPDRLFPVHPRRGHREHDHHPLVADHAFQPGEVVRGRSTR